MNISKNLNYPKQERKNRISSIYKNNVFIYGWGKNKYGELGIGHNSNLNCPW